LQAIRFSLTGEEAAFADVIYLVTKTFFMGKYLLLLSGILSVLMSFGQSSYFKIDENKMNKAITTPEKFLGYGVGEQHTRHEKLVEYFRELDRQSDRVKVTAIGKTYENREQIVAIFTTSANHNRIEEIRQQHLKAQISGGDSKIPLVIHLGYNVHGNEPSSSESAMLTAYYLTASEDPETLNWLNEMVILMDPVINPDGRDRHTHWANMHKAFPPVADPFDREHTEVWPGGRTNHYWFDMNRDWFPVVHQESKNRVNFFHQWRPYVQTDHHEMGSSSTFYFDPGKYSSNNPVVPNYLYDTIYPKYGEYFAKAMSGIGSMYFTKEAFDKLYPGYGSSYINFYGGAGFLFEQGSSRGHIQETTTIPITFAFTIRNQFTASLTTIRASLAERSRLYKLRKDFYSASAEHARKAAVKGYMFGDANDATKTKAFVDLLLTHEIEVYQNDEKASLPYYVPTEQPNYIMVRSIFEKDITYTDSLFYDASTWSLIQAYGLPFTELKAPATKGTRVLAVSKKVVGVSGKSDYAYVFELLDYNAHKAINKLQEAGVMVQTAMRPFAANIAGKQKQFGYGSISIPVNLQRISSDSIFRAVSKTAAETGVMIYPVETGLNIGGIDLGSGYLRTVTVPKVMMVIGSGVAAAEAGEIWHLLDQRLSMTITKMEHIYLNRAELGRYNTIILVSGTYDKAIADKLKPWVQAGGSLITIKGGSEWAIRNGFTKEKLTVIDTPKNVVRYDYDDATEIEGAKALGGSIFQVDLDTTNPIGYGYTKRKLSVYKNSSTFLAPSANPYSTVAKYAENPVVGGYYHRASLEKIKKSASILIGGEGSGRVIMFADDPNFRGTWYGTNKLFLNALFFGSLISVPSVNY
jgi:hypothetical protein